jgi:hypothetical protein
MPMIVAATIVPVSTFSPWGPKNLAESGTRSRPMSTPGPWLPRAAWRGR